MITIREIAAIAGVSRSTVSLVLNNSPLVKEETREKVLRVIHDTGYVPNANARNLNWKSNKSLGVIILSDMERSVEYNFSNSVGLFSLNVMRGISDRLADTAYSLNIEYFSPDAAPMQEIEVFHSPQSLRLPKLLRERKVDGAFIVGGYRDPAFLTACAATGIPLVTVGVGAPEKNCDSVCADPGDATCEALHLLRKAGRKSIGLMNCPRMFYSASMREDAMRRFCREAGIPFDANNVLYSQQNNGESAYDAIREAWENGQRFDGLVSANPQCALGVMRFLAEKNVRIPEDISIIAYEDNALCGYAIPALTAINIQKEQMGARAAELMLARLKQTSLPVQHETIPSYLVKRESV